MDIMKFATCYKIRGIKENMRGILQVMDDLSSIDFDGNKVPLGYIPDIAKDFIRIPSGYPKEKLEKHLSIKLDSSKPTVSPYQPLPFNWGLKVEPYPVQKKIIDDIVKVFNAGGTQGIIDMPTGKGKTLTSLFLSAMLKVPTLIIVKDTKLKDQWIERLQKSSTIRDHQEIIDLIGAGGLRYIDSMSRVHPFYITTHASVRSMIKTIGFQGFNKALIKMGIGLKIVDEFDLEFRNIVEIELNSAVRYNLYLTATTFKSSPTEDKVFKNTFKSLTQTGAQYYRDDVPNRVCEWLNIRTNPTPLQWNKTKAFNGMFSPVKYNSTLFNDLVDRVVNVMKYLVKDFLDNEWSADGGKCALYVDKIDACYIMKEILIKKFNINIKDIGIINSNETSEQKNISGHKKFIITTNKSFGRGVDVENLTYMINFEVYSSKSIFIQQTGRIGRTGGRRGKFVNIVDRSVYNCYNFNRGKIKLLDDIFDTWEEKFLFLETGEFGESDEHLKDMYKEYCEKIRSK